MIHQSTPLVEQSSSDFAVGRILPIYVNGADVLRQECKDIGFDYPDLSVLISDMFATMAGADGVGLAAPQIGLPIRVFVVDLTDFETDDDQEVQNLNPELAKKVFINPRIVEVSDQTCPYKEGCLSVPGINETVNRPQTITIEYLDAQMKPHRETYSGMWSRVIQHEYDHLSGRLFVDNIAPIRKQMLRGKLDSMARGKYNAAYKTK